MSAPATVDGVIARLREIDASLPVGDGVAVFNRLYLTVTERIGAIIEKPGTDAITFRDPAAMTDLDVRFANLWLSAYDADASGRTVTPGWRPLFQARGAGLFPVQYALAGMNAHIEHDLAIAVVGTCRARGLEPEDVHGDYELVNKVLAQVEGADPALLPRRGAARGRRPARSRRPRDLQLEHRQGPRPVLGHGGDAVGAPADRLPA